ncbi:MAG: Protein FecR [Nitrosomonas europaea]|uniref:FecR domain-containing protein n=1 Tax=Nitrosomonas TaxID=914 RepID=UPI0023F53A50|nr:MULTISPECIES: FecR domain-containing protein [Nitrosomonas]MBV6390610.1 Protein FecR [Nitrosomonas europaea]MEB2330861.1 FecR domain-containing protein [Nitrosomonas sp.]
MHLDNEADHHSENKAEAPGIQSAVTRNVADISPQIAQCAVEWLVELQAADHDEATHEAFQRWLAAHPDHKLAWQHIETVNTRFNGLASPLGSAVAKAVLTPRRSLKRRQIIKTLVVILFAGSTGWWVDEKIPWLAWTADERTHIGQRRNITLADGSRVVLNTDTAINIRFTANERRLQLVRGEILVTTNQDSASIARPFIVETAQSELRPLGTRFTIHQQTMSNRLSVFEGAVEIRLRQDINYRHIVQAGEQVDFSNQGIHEIHPADDTSTAWSNGMIIASSMRLANFLAELDRHRPGKLNCDPAVADLRVSGTYPLTDPEDILDALQTTLPVKIQYFTRYWVTVRPAS